MSIMTRLRRKAWQVANGIPPGETPYCSETYHVLGKLRDWRPEEVIVDVGANDGRTILRWRRHLPRTQVFAFEPVGSTFELLKERTAKLDGVHLFQSALGSADEEREIFIGRHSALNSFYAENVQFSGTSERVKVERLDPVLDRLGIDRVALLKIDAEGHDLEVLKGATAALEARRIDVIEVEAGFSAPGVVRPTIEEFQAFLRPFHYHLHAITNQCRQRLGDAGVGPEKGAGPTTSILSYCDAIFVLNNRQRTPPAA